MAELNLSQAEADALMAMEKHRLSETSHPIPLSGGSLSLPLQSIDRRETFLLDAARVVIPKSRAQPERILQAINRPNRDNAQSVAFSWIDTKEVRSANSTAYAILNDAQQPVSSSVLDALKNYDVRPIQWSRRDTVLQELTA